MVQPGDKAPAFELPDADMNMVNSTDCEGFNYVVYFYPKDDTPGCTMEATEFTDMMPDFEKLVTAAFSQRRKTLRNNVKKLVDVEQAAKDIDLSLRAENLTIENFLVLTRSMKKE